MQFSIKCFFAAANTKDLDVFIKRNQESGFGFRVLGGEGPEQPVSGVCAVPTVKFCTSTIAADVTNRKAFDLL